jgi:hypothetical protein
VGAQRVWLQFIRSIWGIQIINQLIKELPRWTLKVESAY